MATKLSELIKEIDTFIKEHGDLELDTEYHCEDCNDSHTGHGWRIDMNFKNQAVIEIIKLGEDDSL